MNKSLSKTVSVQKVKKLSIATLVVTSLFLFLSLLTILFLIITSAKTAEDMNVLLQEASKYSAEELASHIAFIYEKNGVAGLVSATAALWIINGILAITTLVLIIVTLVKANKLHMQRTQNNELMAKEADSHKKFKILSIVGIFFAPCAIAGLVIKLKSLPKA
ncbi:hypothetical protein [Mycoplasmopsis columboralis]|uniref:Uncharacterized protein n=1 Tax=Mycoplasmopsis columboralis TaxID=171282 RepID=A0A449B7L3_9BACT|nr:hypothetical protein [Mycoplasmopsis columboralis]VEU76577.1 Uncharacterised protein [Mycoplasmopsis columboralis]